MTKTDPRELTLGEIVKELCKITVSEALFEYGEQTGHRTLPRSMDWNHHYFREERMSLLYEELDHRERLLYTKHRKK